MKTKQQELGDLGESYVRKHVNCPKCKSKNRSLRALPTNFRCADLICDFCGYLAQVKTAKKLDTSHCPKTIPGAAWGPQKERMDAGIYFPLFLVLVGKTPRDKAIYYLPADLQTPSMFEPRKPLSDDAKRAGWTGFIINLEKAIASPIRLIH